MPMLSMRAVAGCAALALAFASATPARACEGLDCLFAEETKPATAPLQLNTFMRRDAKIARGTAAQRKTKSAAPVKVRKRVKVVKRPAGKALTREVRPALTLPARVVASADLNGINLRAEAPAAERTPMAVAAEPAAWPTGTGESHDIERKVEAAWPAPQAQGEAGSPAPQVHAPQLANAAEPEQAAATRSEPAAEPSTMPDNWAMRVWTMLQTAFSAVVAAARWLAA